VSAARSWRRVSELWVRIKDATEPLGRVPERMGFSEFGAFPMILDEFVNLSRKRFLDEYIPDK
jgi:hypothetical protein